MLSLFKSCLLLLYGVFRLTQLLIDSVFLGLSELPRKVILKRAVSKELEILDLVRDNIQLEALLLFSSDGLSIAACGAYFPSAALLLAQLLISVLPLPSPHTLRGALGRDMTYHFLIKLDLSRQTYLP